MRTRACVHKHINTTDKHSKLWTRPLPHCCPIVHLLRALIFKSVCLCAQTCLPARFGAFDQSSRDHIVRLLDLQFHWLHRCCLIRLHSRRNNYLSFQVTRVDCIQLNQCDNCQHCCSVPITFRSPKNCCTRALQC